MGINGNSGLTPQAAVKHVLYAPAGEKLQIQRTNTRGDYAVVVSRNGQIEGAPAGPILLERFPFGWQALAIAGRCALQARGMSSATVDALLAGVPAPQAPSDKCAPGEWRDVGPTGDVIAVRRQIDGPLVPFVRVVGNYAIGTWYGAGGGENVFGKLPGNTWVFFVGGGGALRVTDLVQRGVPDSVACELLAQNCQASARTKITVSDEQATILVQHYYWLWSARRYKKMYALLSSDYRTAHPYEAWLAQHASTDSIYVDQAQASNSSVRIRLSTEDVSGDRSCPQSQRSTFSVYSGTWTVANEGGDLRLNAPHLSAVSQTTRCKYAQ